MAAVEQLPIATEVERRDGWIIVKAAIPPRVCGLPNEACAARVEYAIRKINPAAYDPVSPQVAEAVQHEILARLTAEAQARGEYDQQPSPPPNCDGLSDQDDDEGEAIPGYPPGTSCAITGECE